MSSSELSDALNPYIAQARARTAYHQHAETTQDRPAVQEVTPTSYVPHRSELEYAMCEQPPPQAQRPPKPKVDGTQVVQQLFRALAATREAHETERKRRVQWEQDVEAKHAQRHAELEAQISDMKQEIASLRDIVSKLLPSQERVASTPRSNASPMLAAPALCPTFDTNDPGTQYQVISETNRALSESGQIAQQSGLSSTTMRASASFPVPSSSTSAYGRKRQTPASSGDEGQESGDSDHSKPATGERPAKRANKHDKRCYTIQHAMRKHIYHTMQVEPDDDLPPSYLEGLPISDEEPVRFVWEKTLKQSQHNTHMKNRVIADLQAHRRLYPHVPDDDFAKKTLSSTFDQAYTTMRQKFKIQNDASVAAAQKAREEHKVMRSRRNGRKRFKLSNRTDTRKNLEAFAHATFDGALQMECMSSEESEDDHSQNGISAPKQKVLVVRGIPWRSTRLLRFFGVLDEDDRLDKQLKPKRNTRKDRNEGPPKVGFRMPPKGVASWMISRRWLRDMQLSHPDLLELLKDIIVDPPGFDWNRFNALGYESEDELDAVSSTLRSQRLTYPPTLYSSDPNSSQASYSLQHALVPTHHDNRLM